MANRKLIVEVVGDTRNLERSFGRASNSVQTFQTRTKSALGSFTKGLAFGAATAGIGGLVASLKVGIDEFQQAEKVAAQTNAVIKATGGVAKVTADHVDELSQSLLRQSGIDDELIKSGENMLLTFRNVRNEVGKGNDIFDRATKAALDLSVAGFGSMQSTAKQLGKALNDPSRGLTQLRRVGVTFTAAQEKQIKRLQESNQILKAQAIILGEVEKRVGGSAKAFGNTLPGQISKLRETFRNFAADLVTKFAPSIEAVIKSLTQWFDSTENQARVQRDLTTAVDTAKKVLEGFRSAAQTLSPILKTMSDALGGAANATKLLITLLVAAKIRSFATALGILGTEASVASTKVGLLNKALLGLPAVVGVTLVVTQILKQANDESQGLLEKISRKDPTNIALEHLGKKSVADRIFGDDDSKKVKDRVQAALEAASASIESVRSTIEAAIARTDTFGTKVAEVAGNVTGGPKLTAEQRNTFFDNALARQLDRVQDSDLQGRVQKLQAIADSIKAQIAKVKDITRKLKLRDDLIAVMRQINDTKGELADDIISRLQLGFDKAQVTKSLDDDLAAANRLIAAIKQRIKKEGETTNLLQQLFAAQQLQIGVLNAQAAKRKQDRQSAQFNALGLDAEGNTPIPGVKGLKKQLGRLSEAVKGTFLDTGKTKSLMAGIRKVLSGGLGKVTDDVRQTIANLLNDIDQQFKDHANKKLTKTTSINADQILGGLGLDRDTTKRLTARLSRFNSAGVGIASKPGTVGAFGVPVAAGGVSIQAPDVFLDGRKVSSNVRRNNTVHGRSNPVQRRGRRR